MNWAYPCIGATFVAFPERGAAIVLQYRADKH
jgi:hypothetical protein